LTSDRGGTKNRPQGTLWFHFLAVMLVVGGAAVFFCLSPPSRTTSAAWPKTGRIKRLIGKPNPLHRLGHIHLPAKSSHRATGKDEGPLLTSAVLITEKH